jgi:hypothetical protein
MKLVRITEIEENDNTNSSVKVWMREDYEDKIRMENWPEKKESETHCWEKREDRVEKEERNRSRKGKCEEVEVS